MLYHSNYSKQLRVFRLKSLVTTYHFTMKTSQKGLEKWEYRRRGAMGNYTPSLLQIAGKITPPGVKKPHNFKDL